MATRPADWTQTADRLLTRPAAADYLGVRPQTMALWASTRRYPIPMIRVGRSVRYRLSDLDAWLASRTVGAETL